ncbi:hypothetical protein BJY24_006597 [Nocardia transvalensis]|uniref:DUF3761 domain-containing protein n=1 Tax=Nocardia transvalensis TaxID=37333 RepID=A0A7W9UMF1_9NOCA|nr:DUF3761 domain-containing protein [Nocardia transvalensis]MBB5917685.1 hypothetical protein [Nocardia transvalensis]
MLTTSIRAVRRSRPAVSGRRIPLLASGLFAAAVATSALVAPTATAGPVQLVCGAGQYENVDHACVQRPEQSATVPDGATAQCNDGAYSFSQHRRGSCSGHGGVDRWLVDLPK